MAKVDASVNAAKTAAKNVAIISDRLDHVIRAAPDADYDSEWFMSYNDLLDESYDVPTLNDYSVDKIIKSLHVTTGLFPRPLISKKVQLSDLPVMESIASKIGDAIDAAATAGNAISAVKSNNMRLKLLIPKDKSFIGIGLPNALCRNVVIVGMEFEAKGQKCDDGEFIEIPAVKYILQCHCYSGCKYAHGNMDRYHRYYYDSFSYYICARMAVLGACDIHVHGMWEPRYWSTLIKNTIRKFGEYPAVSASELPNLCKYDTRSVIGRHTDDLVLMTPYPSRTLYKAVDGKVSAVALSGDICKPDKKARVWQSVKMQYPIPPIRFDPARHIASLYVATINSKLSGRYVNYCGSLIPKDTFMPFVLPSGQFFPRDIIRMICFHVASIPADSVLNFGRIMDVHLAKLAGAIMSKLSLVCKKFDEFLAPDMKILKRHAEWSHVNYKDHVVITDYRRTKIPGNYPGSMRVYVSPEVRFDRSWDVMFDTATSCGNVFSGVYRQKNGDVVNYSSVVTKKRKVFKSESISADPKTVGQRVRYYYYEEQCGKIIKYVHYEGDKLVDVIYQKDGMEVTVNYKDGKPMQKLVKKGSMYVQITIYEDGSVFEIKYPPLVNYNYYYTYHRNGCLMIASTDNTIRTYYEGGMGSTPGDNIEMIYNNGILLVKSKAGKTIKYIDCNEVRKPTHVSTVAGKVQIYTKSNPVVQFNLNSTKIIKYS